MVSSSAMYNVVIPRSDEQ